MRATRALVFSDRTIENPELTGPEDRLRTYKNRFCRFLRLKRLKSGGEAARGWDGETELVEGICPCCTAPAMADSAESCAHCGKQGANFKRCSRCKQDSYCGAACQNANWKRHKKKCAPLVPLLDVAVNLDAAHAAQDWRGVLKWEGRMEELMARLNDDGCSEILKAFSWAHQMGWHATGSKDHARSYIGLQERRIPLFGKLQRFRDQGEAMCRLSNKLGLLERKSEAATWYQRARDVGAAHGFFSLESRACIGLGSAAIDAGRHEEGVALLRNALVAAELNELDDPKYELDAVNSLVQALFKTNSVDEVEPLVLRYREAAKAYSEKEGGGPSVVSEFNSLLCSARLHEARGKLQEAAREVRVLLDLMRENQASVQKWAASCAAVLEHASQQLTVLDPEVGEEELIQAVAAALANLRMP